MDLTGCPAEIHMRTDANNLVTTAGTTHLPEQKETIHMINQLRTEACSGSIDDLAHVISVDCLADVLTKASAKPDYLIKAVETGLLPNVDKHPLFRDLMKGRHKAYFIDWIINNLDYTNDIVYFCGLRVQDAIQCALHSPNWTLVDS